MTRKVLAYTLSKSLPNVDHRITALKQKLFFFDEHSKGSCFFLPRGAQVYNKLINYLKCEYTQRGYHEVITPNIYDCRLWQTSGHWHHYKDNMIKFKISENEFSLKPMNCPGHCLMYKHLSPIASDQLPIRWADFGVLHRNELSGSLVGLTRVRRFQQDDAHIFCTQSQVRSEVKDCLHFAQQVYEEFGFKFDLKLSLRPSEYMGDTRIWDQAENSLRDALNESNLNWTEQENEGAFYGPKIDLVVKDTLERSHQCATIQLDFQLPDRFDLLYKDLDDKNTLKRPVMIHRAIFGSIERFIAMVMENTDGRWPFWLSPVQAAVVPVSEKQHSYARHVAMCLTNAGFNVDCDFKASSTLNKRIREVELAKYNFIIVVGNREASEESATIRLTVDKTRRQVFARLSKIIELFKRLELERLRDSNKEFSTMLEYAAS